MKKKILLFVLSLFLITCKTKEQKLEESLKNTVHIYMEDFVEKNGEEGVIIDSLNIIKIDTVTEKLELSFLINEMTSRHEETIDMFNRRLEIAKLTKQQLALTEAMYGKGGGLSKLEREDLQKETDKVNKYFERSQSQFKIIDSLHKKKQSADSIVFKYYRVGVFCQLIKPNKERLIDSMYLLISGDYKVIPYKEILASLPEDEQ